MAKEFKIRVYVNEEIRDIPFPEIPLHTHDGRNSPVLAPSSVGHLQIAPQAVGEANILDLSITTKKLADAAVEWEKIASNSVKANNIWTGGAVITLSAQIKELVVGTGHMQDLSVVWAKIGNLAVGRSKIMDAAINNAKIDDLAVDNAKIRDLAVDDAKISDLVVEKLTGMVLTGKTIRTAATGRRVMMIRGDPGLAYPNSIRFYNEADWNVGMIAEDDDDLTLWAGDKVRCIDLLYTVAGIYAIGVNYFADTRPKADDTWDLGSSGYRWKKLHLSRMLYTRINDETLEGDWIPSIDQYFDCGHPDLGKWYRVASANFVECPLPTTNSALDTFKKIRQPKIFKGDCGERYYFKDEDFPSEMKMEKPEHEGGGEEIEIARTLGVTVQAVRELLEKTEAIETKVEEIKTKLKEK